MGETSVFASVASTLRVPMTTSWPSSASFELMVWPTMPVPRTAIFIWWLRFDLRGQVSDRSALLP